MSRDWTHRQLVAARGRLLRSARQIDLALERRGETSEFVFRIAFAHQAARDALRDLQRADRRLRRREIP